MEVTIRTPQVKFCTETAKVAQAVAGALGNVDHLKNTCLTGDLRDMLKDLIKHGKLEQ